MWLGDQLVSWDAHDGLKSALLGMVQGGLSGLSMSHSDIGGRASHSFPFQLALELLELS
jgi:alpha-glucosidase (family GH31 glycosyl hydrolase)